MLCSANFKLEQNRNKIENFGKRERHNVIRDERGSRNMKETEKPEKGKNTSLKTMCFNSSGENARVKKVLQMKNIP